MRGIKAAVERLAKWAAKNYQVKLPSSIDTEMAIEYREFLTCRSGLKISTARKELRYISSTFAAGTTKVLLNSNPFYNLPKDRQSAIKNLLASKKTIDSNNTISAEEGLEINQKMLCSGKGTKDPSYDVFVLQAMTGARIQEIAGLRGCDFIKRRVGETEYHCIRITAWEGRGHGALNGSRGGLKKFNPIGLFLYLAAARSCGIDTRIQQIEMRRSRRRDLVHKRSHGEGVS